MNGLVLSGGGGKGAYQIGVWKALRKMHYKIDIVTGTSVGCLNALLITQNSKFLAPFIWSRIDFREIFQDDVKKEQTTKEMLEMYGKNIIKNKGMSTDNLQKKLDMVVNYHKFYNSKTNFGLVAVNLSNLKPIVLTKKDIPKDKLKDYVMASATCFPAFKMKDIDGKKYIDGGYYDVLPINLAIDMGANKIVAVDLKSVGIRRKIKKNNASITYIYPRNNIGHSLLFNRNVNKTNMRYGYNDTLKTFNRLDGDKYTFKKNQICKINTSMIKNNILYFLNMKEKDIKNNLLINKSINPFITNKNNFDDYLQLLEELGYLYKVPDFKIYSLNKFNKILKKQFMSNELIKNIKVYSSKEEVISYLYYCMINNDIKKIKKASLLHCHEFICAVYLYTIIKGEYHAV